jgi:diphthine-ammonia ligase
MPACAISWSGGKDSMLAGVCMRNAGADVPLLVTMFDDAGASKSHALPIGLLQAQARALGAELLAVPAAPQRYAEAFHSALLGAAQRGIEHMVFGDIDLQAHRDWIEPACARAGIRAVFPLWGHARADVAREIVECGIRAIVVCVDVPRLGAAWCGRDYDAGFLQSLPSGVCPCAEDGEFHTFVWDGPGFAAPLKVQRGVLRFEASRPPLAPTTLALCTPTLLGCLS